MPSDVRQHGGECRDGAPGDGERPNEDGVAGVRNVLDGEQLRLWFGLVSAAVLIGIGRVA